MTCIPSSTWRMLSQPYPQHRLPKGLDAVWEAVVGHLVQYAPRTKRFLAQARQVLELENVFASQTDAQLRTHAEELHVCFRRGRDKLADRHRAFALIREVAFRQIGERPFATQVAGGLAMEAGNLMGALDIYNEISYKYPEFPDLTEKVLNRIEKVKTVIAEKRRSDAEAALQEASTFYNQNPDQAEKAKEMFEEIQKKWEETPAAVIAKLKAKEIEDNLTKFQGETQDREYKKAVAEASSLVAKRDYDGAVQKLREFAARYAGANAGNDATAEVNRLEKEVEEIYNTAKKEAVQRVEKKAYGLAIAVLDQFIKVYGSAKWRGEAGKYKGQIQQEAMKTFQEACREPNAMVGQFRFEEALAKFQILATQYEGTQWGVFTRMRMQSIQAQADLHGEVIHQIKMLAKKGESPRLPFELKNFPHIKFRIVDADVKQIFLESEAEPKFRQPFNWVDFTPRQILDIYKLFIPNPTQEQNSWLGYFCQERDLVDDAEKYFNKAGQ